MSDAVDALLEELDLDEKIALCAGADMWTTPGVARLGIPALRLTDGPNGARGLDVPGTSLRSACFPCGTALAATWSPALARRVGEAIGGEARAKGAHVLLAPTVNIHRHPLAGRNFECYAEDPLLAARMASAFIEGVQSRGVAACVKHFVCNDSEFERHTISSEVGPRALREIYLPPFEAAVREAGVWSLMGAYNRVSGTFACEHEELLTRILREEWGFDGFVVSDWFATQSAAPAARAGLDLEMPGPPRHFGELRKAVEEGELPAATLDAMVRRLLAARERAGALRGDARDGPPRALDRPEDRRVAREAAAEAIVLLKNAGGLLPFDASRLESLAVIGPNAAASVIQGGGSAQVTPHRAVSALEGIRARCGDGVSLRFERGCTRHRTTPLLVAELLAPGAEGGDPLRVELFAGGDLAGEPAHVTSARHSELTWFGAPAPGVPEESFGARCLATLVAPESGRYVFSLTGAGRSRLLVDGRLVVDDWEAGPGGDSFFGLGSPEVRGEIPLEAGRRYEVCIEFAKKSPKLALAGVRAGCEMPAPPDLLERAVACAGAADAAVVVVGLDAEWETEGRDREDLSLPGRQHELVKQVAAANPRTVVVVNAGSQVEMPWLEAAAAVLQLWYAGQELGHALADVLFGDTDAAGRLPTSFPRRLEDAPAFPHYPGADGRVRYAEDVLVGYRHYDTQGVAPLFPFGHGLSYTSFRYGALSLAAERFGPDDPIEAAVEVTNAGARAGCEVVQLYLHDEGASLPRPEQELVGFEKLRLAPGESATARFRLDRRALSFYDPDRGERGSWVAEPGAFELRAGSSSRDIRARARFTLDG